MTTLPDIDGLPASAGRVVPPDLPDAAAIMGRAGGENFPVALGILGRTVRDRLLALYGWARLVDELGDGYRGDRLAALDWADAELDDALAGRSTHPLVERAAGLVRDTGADPQLLRDLLEANRLDQRVTRYATYEDLVGYCRWSANPVGRLVLAVFDAATPERERLSDLVCTALQLVEHTQDLAEDAAAGRIYLPADELRRFGVEEAELTSGGPAGPELRALVAFQAQRARRVLAEGSPLVASLRGRARLAVAGFVAGGDAAIDGLVAAGFDPLAGAPPVPKARLAARAVRLLAPGGRS